VQKFKQARARGTGVARWRTWLAGKGKEVSFETALRPMALAVRGTHRRLSEEE